MSIFLDFPQVKTMSWANLKLQGRDRVSKHLPSQSVYTIRQADPSLAITRSEGQSDRVGEPAGAPPEDLRSVPSTHVRQLVLYLRLQGSQRLWLPRALALVCINPHADVQFRITFKNKSDENLKSKQIQSSMEGGSPWLRGDLNRGSCGLKTEPFLDSLKPNLGTISLPWCHQDVWPGRNGSWTISNTNSSTWTTRYVVSQGHHLPLGHWGLSEWDKDVSLFALPGRTTLHQLKGQSAR